ncbi:MAG: hypothetical protein AAGD96_34645 [Chloroflexota bacterium]
MKDILAIVGNVFKIIESLVIAVMAPLGGLVAGTLGAIYAYFLFDVRLVFCFLIVGICFFSSLIWRRRYVMFVLPILIYVIFPNDGDDETQSWWIIFVNIMMVLYIVALGLIILAIFQPTLLGIAALMHAAYVLVIIADPEEFERRQRAERELDAQENQKPKKMI